MGYILSIHPGSIVLCADGDEAGRRANAQWAAELAKRGRDSVITFWPDGDDPASYLARYGPAGLAAVTLAEANRPLDDSRRWQNTYPVPAAPVRARFVAGIAVGEGRPLDQAVLQSLKCFGRNDPSAR